MHRCTRFVSVAALAGVFGWLAVASPSSQGAGADAKETQEVVNKAVSFLKKRQGEDGSFSPKIGGPGVTAMLVAGLLRNGYNPDDPLITKSMKYLEGSVQKNGGIYDKQFANYTTSVALMAFVEANTKGQYDTVIKNAAKFLKTMQDDALEEKDAQFGGVGYDGKGRPDLSNTQYFVDALAAAGVPKNDPAIQKALRFVSRSQNLPGSEANDQPFAAKTSADDKGGLTYNPSDNAKNPARTPEGGLRSSGVMTYAGLKTFLFAGVGKEDARVKGALDWIRRHYTLEDNPGQGTAGLYYYYHTFGKAMSALGEDEFTDKDGKKHDWRKDLFEILKKKQKEDGSWTNDNRAFMETNPDLATAYALLALSYTKPGKK